MLRGETREKRACLPNINVKLTDFSNRFSQQYLLTTTFDQLLFSTESLIKISEARLKSVQFSLWTSFTFF